MSHKPAVIRALSGFIGTGPTPVQAGDILTVSESQARELIHMNKAERYVAPEPEAPKPTPAAEAPVEVKTKPLSIKKTAGA